MYPALKKQHKKIENRERIHQPGPEYKAKNYRIHAEWADELGGVELKVKLEEMAADEAVHAREIRRILKGM